MKLLMQLMLCAVAIVIASAEPCAASTPSHRGRANVSVTKNHDATTFAAEELNSAMMQESTHKVADGDGQEAVSKSFAGGAVGLIKEYPVTSLLILCGLLWVVFKVIIKKMRYMV